MIGLGRGERLALLSHFQTVEAFTQALKNTGKKLIVGNEFFYSDNSISDKRIESEVFDKDLVLARKTKHDGLALAHALNKLK